MKEKEFLIEKITYKEAAQFLFDMKNQSGHEEMEGHIMGIMKAGKIKSWVKKEKYHGILFWYCLGMNGMKPYLAVEKKDQPYNSDISWLESLIPNRPVKHSLGMKIVQDVFPKIFSPNDTVDSIEVGIRNEKAVRPRDFLVRDSRKVSDMKNNFKKFHGEKMNFPFAFFSTKAGDNDGPFFNQFFDQGDVKSIRYYIGYSSKEKFKRQEYRLILVPCTEEGRNFKNSDCTSKHQSLFEDPILLETSWPPPPQQ
jgi:hypothetical protein